MCEIHRLAASCLPLNGGLARNTGMCPDRESSQQPFGLQASTQSTEPHQPEQVLITNLYQNIIFFGRYIILDKEQNQTVKCKFSYEITG